MAHFVFQLDGVLRHREHIKQQCQRELAALQGQKAQCEAEIRALSESAQSATADARANLIGPLNMAYLAGHRRYMLAVQRQGAGLVQRLAGLQKQVQESQRALAEAAKQKKILEKLRDKQQARWTAALAKREADDLDELSTQMTYQGRARLAEDQPQDAEVTA